MKEKLIRRTELARWAGVYPSAITKACRNSLKNAVVGKYINAEHRSVIEYVAMHNPRGSKFRGHTVVRDIQQIPERKPYEIPKQKPYEIPEDMAEYADRTLREIVDEFGTNPVFFDLLKAVEKIESIRERRLRNDKVEEKLVSKVLMKKGIIDPMDTMLRRLLTDGSKTIARRVDAMSNAKKTQIEMEEFVRDQITSFIRAMKVKVKSSFENV